MKKDLEYEKNNFIPDIGEIKCKNYELCRSTNPKDWFDYFGRYTCMECDIFFGTWGEKTGKGVLEFSDNVECPICHECKRGVSYPNCNHKACIKCFRRSWYGISIDDEPEFPYPEIMDEFYSDEDNPKWAKDYPLISSYMDEWHEWWQTCEKQCDSQENLQKCPLCRL